VSVVKEDSTRCRGGAAGYREPPEPGHPLPHLLVKPDTAPRAELPKVPSLRQGAPKLGGPGDDSGLRSEMPLATTRGS
jgi:hypothetical protein